MADEAKRATAANSAPTAHPDSYEGKSPIKARKLGHLVYEVSDVERTAKFWTDVMGFEESDRNEHGMIFFRCGSDHHAIGLKPGKAERRPRPSDGLNIEHLALEVDNTDVMLQARDYLRKNNIPIVFEGRKGAGCNLSLHFLDPDGYEFEIYCNMDQVDETGRMRPEGQFHRVNSLDEAVANPVPKDW